MKRDAVSLDRVRCRDKCGLVTPNYVHRYSTADIEFNLKNVFKEFIKPVISIYRSKYKTLVLGIISHLP